ncbi:MAG: hypothetical protein GXW90_05290 [Tepidanaerobacter acetatoxydans]|jgi:hypothetical protein|uniref:hypothetical protein n=1 Tax=Tepidanaerobacter TaxID=499228 RepID=UPI0025DC8031|nr:MULTISPECIES: hypothetical protein [Tepidanaerobacter]NLU10346.1 hypothetical protein [Tepidanaerobacter acetatoxydans]
MLILKKAVASKLIYRTLAEYGVNGVIELRETEEALKSLLGNLVKDIKLTYKEIADLTELSFSMVQRLASRGLSE